MLKTKEKLKKKKTYRIRLWQLVCLSTGRSIETPDLCCEIFRQGFAKSLVNVPVALQLFKTSPRFGDVISVVGRLEP